MSHADCNGWRFALGATISTNATTFTWLINSYGLTGLLGSLSGLPVIGWILALYGAAIIVRSAEQIVSSFMGDALYKKGIDISIGFSWAVPYLKCSARTK